MAEGIKIYYADQSSWGMAEYYSLFRYLNRLLLNVKGSRVEEIQALDLSNMTQVTKVLLYCMLSMQNKLSWLDEYENLADLRNVTPLTLVEKPRDWYPIFESYGIRL